MICLVHVTDCCRGGRLELVGIDMEIDMFGAVLGVQERGSCIYRVMQEGRSMCWEVGVTAVVR